MFFECHRLEFNQFIQIVIELVCTIIFSIQIAVRISSAPTSEQIYADMCFWFECFSVLANIFMYIILDIQQSTKISLDPCLTMITFLRSFRIFRFARQISGLKIFLRSIIYAFRELIYLFVIFITIILFFGELIYLLEQGTIDSPIRTITGKSSSKRIVIVCLDFFCSRCLLAYGFDSDKSWLW